ncbi:hypothetical protein VX159_06410 [Dechloromonas sp. ZY10]|uniref:hypothetical protein n=1 Tax=Dechloromonas aquae TaxID=2664436 RepID=UPI0035299518
MAQRTLCMQSILAALQAPRGLSLDALALASGISRRRLLYGGYLGQLKQLQQIHIGGWQRTESGRFQPIYRAGPGTDLPRPKIPLRTLDSAGLRRIEQVLTTQGAMGYRALASATGLSCSTLKNGGYLEALLVQRRIHIQAWQRSQRGPMQAIYAIGDGPAAVPPAPFSAAEKSRRYRQRKQAHSRLQAEPGPLPAASLIELLLLTHSSIIEKGSP